MTFNLDEYVDVPERIKMFAEKYPDGSLQSELTRLADGWLCKAHAYRTPDDERPGVGHAFEPVPGKTPYTKDSEAMNAETSAWGRAIVALGFETKKIASKQEVKARQTSGAGASVVKTRDAASSHPSATPAPEVTIDTPGSSEIGFGKHKGALIRDVPKGYLEWWLNSEMGAKPEFSALRAEIELFLGLEAPATAPGGASLMDDIPFAPVIA